MIDTEVVGDDGDGCKYAGVKNAWIEKKQGSEVEVFVNRKQGQLLHLTLPRKLLWILKSCTVYCWNSIIEIFGDLNDNSLRRTLVIEDHPELWIGHCDTDRVPTMGQ